MAALTRVCVYAASSREADPEYYAAARRLGRLLAEASVTVVFGGGANGAMGALADGALAAGGRLIGILPRFMQELEWAHPRLSELRVVEDMRERKHQMLQGADGVVALPGGSGTLEELLEAITLKRLGLYFGPIVLVNVRGFYDPLLRLLEDAIAERFMDERHRAMWRAVAGPDDVLPALRSAPAWPEDARGFAVR
jgi:uncharacterized protein (TIGR00730 family)